MIRTTSFAAVAAAFATAAASGPARPSVDATPIVVAQMDHDHAQGGGQAALPGAAARVGPIAVAGAYVRAPAAPGGAAGAYMTIASEGAADRLIAASSPAAKRVELHAHTLDDAGVARMRPVEGGIAVAPGAPVALRPGGLHVMMMGVTQELAEGGAIELTLTFENAGAVTMTLPVVAFGEAMKHGG